jgi:hypothetical protein
MFPHHRMPVLTGQQIIFAVWITQGETDQLDELIDA